MFRFNLEARYGLTVEQFDELLTKQNNACDICKAEFVDEKGKRPHVDHNHETGDVRGLLCLTCNSALGKFRDDLETVRSAVRYLRKHQK